MPRADIARIAVDNTAYSFDKPYDYRIPKELLDSTKKGCRVTVPFGNSAKKRQGMILDVIISHEYGDNVRLKSISQVLDSEPLLSDELLLLVSWLKERTFCTLYDAVKALLPVGINHKIVASYALSQSDLSLSGDEAAVADYLRQHGGFVKGDKIASELGILADSGVFSSLVKKGVLARNYDAVRNVGDKTVKMIRLSESYLSGEAITPKLTKKQEEVVKLLSETGGACVREVCYFTGFTQTVPLSLCSKGVAELYECEVYRNPSEVTDSSISRDKIVLTEEQQQVFQNLLNQYRQGIGSASLLFGVTGSGKTKVYMKLVDEVFSGGRGVILMVPEIALTPQALRLFRERYGSSVAVFHSALSMGERLDEWKRVQRGEAKIVVGTRSAVFAPLSDIGLIIIDEEQESTYKSESSPRYSAKDVSRFRCAYHGALLVLASATPSVESYASALKGRYTLNKLTERYGTALLPEVQTVDMCAQKSDRQSKELSDTLISALRDNIEKPYLIAF